MSELKVHRLSKRSSDRKAAVLSRKLTDAVRQSFRAAPASGGVTDEGRRERVTAEPLTGPADARHPTAVGRAADTQRHRSGPEQRQNAAAGC